MERSNVLQRLQKISPTLVKLYARAGLWHGTGRYAHQDGQVVDLLQGIIKEGGLTPHLDRWDQKRGDSYTISIARARVYARLYAELYRTTEDRNLIRSIRPRMVWSAYFFLSAKWVAWNEYTVFRPHITDVREKSAEWTKRLARKPRSFTGAFLFGASDISENYPILVGIRPGSIHPTRGSRFIDLHEERSSSAVSLTDFTHIEVPRKNIEETMRIIRKANILLSVLAIEDGDAYCWNFKFKHLASGLTLSPICT
ncbi:MAG: hypothetical protein JWL75_431 [Parcubacteria group bacterium]|nr:hypothetical protein [Parcubacteria group bacterium]